MEQQQNQLLQQALQISQLQEQNHELQQKQQNYQQALAQIQELQEQVQQLLPLQQQNQQQQQQIQQLQQQPIQHLMQVDSDLVDDPHDPLVMGAAMMTACEEGDVETITSLIDAGKSVNCVSNYGNAPIMLALWYSQLNAVIVLAERGADLSTLDNMNGANVLHFAAMGGDLKCLEWVLSNTSIDVNSTDTDDYTSCLCALNADKLPSAMLLAERGANLFIKNNFGDNAMDNEFGPQVLQHVKDLVWESVKPLLRLSKACSLAADDSHSLILPSVVKVFGIFGIVELISMFVRRNDLIVRDPEDDDKEQEPDEVKVRIEAELAAARRDSVERVKALSLRRVTT
jgi:ankyrin repeat protein